jgi:hypothetical protein
VAGGGPRQDRLPGGVDRLGPAGVDDGGGEQPEASVPVLVVVLMWVILSRAGR